MGISSSLIAMLLVVILWFVFLLDRAMRSTRLAKLEERVTQMEAQIRDLRHDQASDNSKLTQLEIEVSNIR